ncbi:MAG: ankyrin repeat domain-containing protein, partial [Holosporaceae bacterium]|nr:ankyrin repeat domain-containing protein [Holosporaceae bacterium]
KPDFFEKLTIAKYFDKQEGIDAKVTTFQIRSNWFEDRNVLEKLKSEKLIKLFEQNDKTVTFVYHKGLKKVFYCAVDQANKSLLSKQVSEDTLSAHVKKMNEARINRWDWQMAHKLYTATAKIFRKIPLKFQVVCTFLRDRVKRRNKVMSATKALVELCSKGNPTIEQIQAHLNDGADIDGDGEFVPLVHVCKAHKIDFDVVKFLLNNGANINRYDQWNDMSALEAASYNNGSNTEVVQYLIEHGADVNGGSKLGPLGSILIQGGLAMKISKLEIIELLIDHGARVKDKSIEPDSVLQIMASNLDSAKKQLKQTKDCDLAKSLEIAQKSVAKKREAARQAQNEMIAAEQSNASNVDQKRRKAQRLEREVEELEMTANPEAVKQKLEKNILTSQNRVQQLEKVYSGLQKIFQEVL